MEAREEMAVAAGRFHAVQARRDPRDQGAAQGRRDLRDREAVRVHRGQWASRGFREQPVREAPREFPDYREFPGLRELQV